MYRKKINKAPPDAPGTMDLSGKKISTYLIDKISEKLEGLNHNEFFKVKTDNYKAIQSDTFARSRMTVNKVVLTESNKNNPGFEITKVNSKFPRKKSLSIIISDQGLEELLSPLGFSLATALSGYKVNIHFRGPVVKVLDRKIRFNIFSTIGTNC